jgi:hypothetical protein
MMGEKEEKIFTQHLQNESISERLVKRDSEELSKNGDQLKTIRLQKESEWEKKWNDGVRPCAWDEVADFITAIVSTREKEIAEEVEKKLHEVENYRGDEGYGYRAGLRAFLAILKH